jgi:hypothetical protein
MPEEPIDPEEETESLLGVSPFAMSQPKNRSATASEGMNDGETSENEQ